MRVSLSSAMRLRPVRPLTRREAHSAAESRKDRRFVAPGASGCRLASRICSHVTHRRPAASRNWNSDRSSASSSRTCSRMTCRHRRRPAAAPPPPPGVPAVELWGRPGWWCLGSDGDKGWAAPPTRDSGGRVSGLPRGLGGLEDGLDNLGGMHEFGQFSVATGAV